MTGATVGNLLDLLAVGLMEGSEVNGLPLVGKALNGRPEGDNDGSDVTGRLVGDWLVGKGVTGCLDGD